MSNAMESLNVCSENRWRFDDKLRSTMITRIEELSAFLNVGPTLPPEVIEKIILNLSKTRQEYENYQLPAHLYHFIMRSRLTFMSN